MISPDVASTAGDLNDKWVPYRHSQPRESPPELVIPDAVPRDERIWVPVEDNVWFRPLLLSASRGYWMNLLNVKKSGVLSRHRHPMPVHAFVLKGEWRYLDRTAQHRSAVSNRMPAWLGATTTLLRALLHRNRPPPPSSRPRRNQPSRLGAPPAPSRPSSPWPARSPPEPKAVSFDVQSGVKTTVFSDGA